MSKALTLILSLLLCIDIIAQETFTVNDVQDRRSESQAFINATIYVDHQTVISNGTLLISEGKVVSVGIGIAVPKGYVVNDLKGKFVYPSFVDIYSDYGMPAVPRPPQFSFNRAEQLESDIPGAYNVNEAIKSQFIAAENFKREEKKASSMRNMGFGAVSSFKADGIARGTGVVVTLGEDNENKSIVKHHAATYYSLRKGSSSQSYPISLMGGIALLRQTHYDAQWYAGQKDSKFVDQSLEAFHAYQGLPQVMEVRDWQEALTIDRVGDNLGVQYLIKSSGDSYKRLSQLKATKATFIVPLSFPKAPEVKDPLEAERVSLQEMLHWELAPANLAQMERNQIPFVITSTGAKSSFWKNLRKAISAGLSEEAALKALTITPAKVLGISDQVGAIKAGNLANFLVTSDTLFSENSLILDHWIRGKKYPVNQPVDPEIEGKYSLQMGSRSHDLELRIKNNKVTGKIVINDSTNVKVKVTVDPRQLGLIYSPDPKKPKGTQVRLSGWKSQRNWIGTGVDTLGLTINWQATYQGVLPADTASKSKEEEKAIPGSILYPFRAYGQTQVPKTESVLFRNATVWTNESNGILENADVLVENGKITQVGTGISGGNARVVDATGKHLTSGIIDEHSHIALKSVNDIATVSAMVRMGDVVNSEDINIYRQLSGGVTAAQLLHGSANPVGGQSALVKLKWGSTPSDMLISGAKPYIKFALGENVKRSSNRASVRYPQTRMGVEQVFVDGFTRARAYGAAWNEYNALSNRARASELPPRRDLALEALWEILRGDRFVTCHSYVQSEINMLMKVAEQFDFRVQTFTHILEGYKVADKMHAHGVGGSTFSDWWGYKYEVIEAIPYNASLMSGEGVVTAINSDNAEMGRRLNQEAAKSVKYGGMSEEDAWKMVTLNPAKLLQLDHRMGSIVAGMDADLVLWTDNPLSVYATVEQTMIDGAVYFERIKDEQHQQVVAAERNRLIQSILQSGEKPGAATAKQSPPQLQCEDLIYEN